MRKIAAVVILAGVLVFSALAMAQDVKVIGKWIDRNPRWGTVYTLIKTGGAYSVVRQYAGGKSDTLKLSKSKLNGESAYISTRSNGYYFQPLSGGRELAVGDRTGVKVRCPAMQNLDCDGYEQCAEVNP